MADFEYPLPVFHFSVDWGDGYNTAFSEVSGLTVELDVIEYNDGVNPSYSSYKMPGRKKNGNITMKRGVLNKNSNFYKWWNSAKQHTIERRDLTISLLDEEGKPAMTWKVKKAWPLKVEGPSLKADGKEVAIESIEMAHEGIEIE